MSGISNLFEVENKLDTRGRVYCQNIAIWFDGTFRPAKGHHGDCVWVYDGQVFYHTKETTRQRTRHRPMKPSKQIYPIIGFLLVGLVIVYVMVILRTQ